MSDLRKILRGKLEDLKTIISNIKIIVKKHVSVLHSSHKMLLIFPENAVNVTCRWNKNLKELISQSLFPRTINKSIYSIEKCNMRCNIFRTLHTTSTEFTCHATRVKYNIRGFFTCDTKKYYLSDSTSIEVSWQTKILGP